MDIVKFQEELKTDFGIVKEALAKIVEESKELRIEGVEDSDGYAKAKEVVKDAGKIRRNIEDKRKKLKAESVEIGRLIDSYAKELQTIINPLEERLKEEINIVESHYEKQKALKKAQELWPERKEKLKELGYEFQNTESETEKLMLLSESECLILFNELNQKKIQVQENEIRKLREAAEAAERQEAEKKRIAEAEKKARELERERILNELAKQEAAKAAENERLRIEQEQQRKKMSDWDKMYSWYDSILNLPRPELSKDSMYVSDMDEIITLVMGKIS